MAGHLLDVLSEVANRQLLRHRHVPIVRHLLAGNHPEERGLAGAVRSDEADLVARIELEGGVNEEICRPYCLLMRENEIM